MLVNKLLIIRDRGTEIQALATLMMSGDEDEQKILQDAGYSHNPVCVLLSYANRGGATCEPSDWRNNGRTMGIAHEYIIENWRTIKTGDTIDVRIILGESIND